MGTINHSDIRGFGIRKRENNSRTLNFELEEEDICVNCAKKFYEADDMREIMLQIRLTNCLEVITNDADENDGESIYCDRCTKFIT
jgi:hypothetical protein